MRLVIATALLALAAPAAHAALVDVTVTVENLSPANSVSFAPLRFGFHNGTFDAFENGAAATAPIISIAEGGSGTDWFPAFAAAEPNPVLGSTMGALLPGATFTTMAVRVDTAVNRYFTFGSMVVPSNDHFIGNDDPLGYRIFDMAGNLLIPVIDQTSDEIWNAGSEATDPANAAFLVGGDNDQRTPEGGVVRFERAELSAFNGLTTAPGYIFTNSLTDGQLVYRIRFTAAQVADVPAPAPAALFTLGLVGLAAARRRA